MKINLIIEKYFWIFLIVGILIGLWQPFAFETPKYLPKILLGMMLFFVFLKIDALEIIEKMRNFRLMIYIALVYMIIIPILFFLLVNIFDRQLALGILLLTAMPAGVSTAALTDILKGNISLAMSITIVTQVIAPFTVPFLFWLIGTKGLDINKFLLFKDISILVFSPLILAQVIKKYFPEVINKTQHLFTSANVESKENKIALSITSAYMNNGLAIVLASTYFGPGILVLMVLSEIPWNTLLAPFRRILRYL